MLVEAAACGRPVVTTDHPGCRDAIDVNISGVLVPVGDVQRLAAAIEELLSNGAMRQSMGRAANCYDNAVMESCFGTIKTELEMTEYHDSRQARCEIASYLPYYNTQRRHSALNYLSPAAFEAQLALSP